MRCVVYKSRRKPDTYLYLSETRRLTDLPAALHALLGTLAPVLELELDPHRYLARADPVAVMQALADAGYYLQMPPAYPVSET